jgi:hypothetical protein
MKLARREHAALDRSHVANAAPGVHSAPITLNAFRLGRTG